MNKTAVQKGYFLPIIIFVVAFFITLSLVLVSSAIFNLQIAKRQETRVNSLNIAEAGINYYLWHLSHDNKDYQDGTGAPLNPPYGPYVRSYADPSGNTLGTYTLWITPPPLGSSVVTVEAQGQATNSKEKRTIEAKLGIPSFAQYAFLTGTEAWFGDTERTTGPVHSNIGVHMDGVNNGIVSAGSTTYKPSYTFGGDGQTHNGVWGNGGPTSDWVYPVPRVDFTKVTTDLQKLKTDAQSQGRYLGSSNQSGYLVELTTVNIIYISKVTRETTTGLQTTGKTSYSKPTNGILFLEDNVWIKGTFNGRITVVAARLPDTQATNKSISIIDNLLYSVKDGSVAIGLIAQKDILIPRYSPQNLEINAALLAQKGHAYRPYYPGNIRTQITIYGSITSYDWWTWSWVNSQGQITSGYINTSQTYDNYLTLSPPPAFPTTGSFAVLSWKEK